MSTFPHRHACSCPQRKNNNSSSMIQKVKSRHMGNSIICYLEPMSFFLFFFVFCFLYTIFGFVSHGQRISTNNIQCISERLVKASKSEAKPAQPFWVVLESYCVWNYIVGTSNSTDNKAGPLDRIGDHNGCEFCWLTFVILGPWS